MIKNWCWSFLTRIGLCLGLLAYSAVSAAGGIYISSQSASSLGVADAGAAVMDDASANFYNPAALAQLDHTQFLVSVPLLVGYSHFEGLTVNPRPISTPLSITGRSSAVNASVIPQIYFAHPINDFITFGLGINAPFGLSAVHGEDSFLRAHTAGTKLINININPNLVFKINEQFAVAGGINAIYVKFKNQNNLFTEFFVPPAGPVVPLPDARVTTTSSDWTLGWNVGLFFSPSEDTRVGLSYRSGFVAQLEGDSEFNHVSIGRFISDIKGRFPLPDIAMFSVYQKITKRYALLASATFERWKKLDNVTLNGVASPLGPVNLVGVFNFKDSWTVAFGTEYDLTDKLKLRKGFKYVTSPTNGGNHTVLIPGGDIVVSTIGFRYKHSDAITVDAGYAFAYMMEECVNHFDTSTGVLSQGKLKNHANLIAMSVAINLT